jgi:beta-lactamase regulating signal transducer with metallopeptidase domain
MLKFQVQLLTAWWQAADTMRERLHHARDDERGEITATTALIVILVIAAIAAGGVIAAKIAANANNVPSP